MSTGLAAVATGLVLLVATSSLASAATAPANTAAPSITGSADVGRTLTADKGTWTGDPTPTFTYQWQRCTVGSSYDSNVLGTVGNDPWGIALDSAGNVYTANYSGGSGSTVSKLLPNGTPAGGNWPVSIADATDIFIDSSDNIFVAGGPRFSKLSTSGAVAFTNLTGQSGARGIVTDSSGNIYVANYGTDTVSKFDSSGTAAGGVWPVSVGDGPTDLVIDSTGNLFTSNETSENVSKVTPGGTATTFGSTGLAPQTLALDSSGNILVPNFNSKLRKITPDGSSSTNLGDTGGLPRGIVLDPSDNAFTANASGSSRNVTRITPTGTSTVIADVGSQPHGIARDAAGNLYVSNLGDDNVSKLSPSLSCTDISGAVGSNYSLTGDDEGKQIKVKVTATNSAGTANSTSAATATVGPEPSPSVPSNTSDPSVSGTAEVGSTLTASNGTWSGYPEPTFTYQWERCEDAVVSSILGTTGSVPAYLTVDSAGNVFTSNALSDNVSKITPDGVSSILGTTGSTPYSIALDANGNAYTANYGSNNVSKITPGGTSSIFATTNTEPRDIAIDSAGNLYVSNALSNNVTKITSGGSSSTLGTTGTSPYGIALDSAGNLYVANIGSNNVTKITPGGSSSILGTTGTQPVGLALDSVGNVYTANYGSNDVTKITPGGSSSILGSTGTNPYGLVVDSSGNVYTANAGAGNVTRLTPEGIPSVWGTTGATPRDIAIDSSGNVYTANSGSNNVSKIGTGLSCTDISGADDPTYTLTADDEGKKVRVKVTATNDAGSAGASSEPTATVEPASVSPPENTSAPTVSGIAQQGQTLTADPGTWTGDPTPTFTYQWQRCEQGDPVSSILGTTGNLPTELIRDQEGNIYTANLAGNNVSKITPGGVTSTVGTTGNEPNSLVRDSAGNIYTSNQAANSVTKITPGGSSSVFSPTGFLPRAIVADDAGNLYTPNQNGGNVTKIAPDGTPSGSSPFYAWAATGPGTSPIAAVFDEDGNLYVANAGANNVTKITPDGTASVFANTGDFPYDITIDREGNLYTSNVNSQTVTKITPAGETSTLGATGGGPVGIAVDGAGNVYTSNQTDNTVTLITPFGVSSTYASTGSTPRAVIVDEGGVLYTANFASDDVSKIVPGELNCTDIDGATEEDYTAAAADVGKKLRVKVTGANSEGAETATSAPTATVVPDEVAVTVQKSGGTITSEPAGINCGTTCTANFPFNQDVTLVATPDADKAFDVTASECPGQGWDFDGDAYRCTVKADQALDVSISFRSPKTIWVNTGSTGSGGSCENPDYTTVGAAENAAIDGDTIRICEGEFSGASSGKDLTYEGEGPGKTVIVGSGEDNEGFYFNATSSTVRNLTIRGASSGIFIGGQEETLSVANVSFEENSGFRGAGIQAYGTSVEVSNSTFTGNSAVSGSAIWAFGPVTVVNSTISGNSKLNPVGRGTAGFTPEPEVDGGMIVTNTFVLDEEENDIILLNVTLADNDLNGSPSLLTLCEGEGPCPEGDEYPSGDIDVTNSIIAEDGTGCFTPYSGEVVSGGGNVIQNTTTGCDNLISGPPAPDDRVSSSALGLQPLTVNPPGETATMALANSSVARGAAVSAECPEKDQRGVARPVSSCDAGAYQSAATPPPSGRPKLKVSVTAPKKVNAGKRFTIQVRTTNRAKAQATRSTAASTPSTTATKVKTCVKLPRGIFVVSPRKGGKVSGRTVCWTKSSLAAGRSVSYSVVVRSSSSDSGRTGISATARAKNSSGATATAKARSKIDIVKPKPKPRPKPPTG